MTLSVIIVTRNAAQTVADCLRALREAAGGPRELICVDAASTDGTPEVVRQHAPDATVVTTENRGFGAGANEGACRATGDILWFLNPDAELPPGALPRLLQRFSDPGVVAVSGLLVRPDGTPEPVGEPFPSFWWYIRRRFRPPPPTLSSLHPRTVPWLSGAALLVRTDAFRAVGGFDAGYFLYYEDIDLCRRLAARGGRCALDPAVRIRHRGGTSAARRQRLVYSDQSEDRYFRRFRPRWEWLALRAVRPFLRRPVRALLPLGVLLGVGATLLSPFVAGAVALVAALFTLAVRVPDAGAGLLLGSLLTGPVLRVPLPGLAAALTLTDALLPVILAGWAVRVLGDALRGRVWSRRHLLPTAYCLLPVAAVLPGLILAAERLPAADWWLAASYAARLLALLALIPLGALVLRHPRRVVAIFLAVVALLALVGLLQFWLLPSTFAVAALAPHFCLLPSDFCLVSGFDPHPSRLFSTWLDPNLLGGLFVLVLAVLLGWAGAAHGSGWWFRPGMLLAGVLALAALFLTKSRTSLLALAVVALAALLLQRPWRRMVAVASAGLIGLALLPGLAARLGAISFEDPTTALRFSSWRQALEQWTNFPVFGLGYNAYGAEQLAVGNIRNPAIHSRAGADNSFLTLAATTGVWGIAFSLVAIGAAVWGLLRMGRRSLLGYPAVLALVGLTAHAQFVHSLTYVHLAVPLALLIAGAVREQQGDRLPKSVKFTDFRSL